MLPPLDIRRKGCKRLLLVDPLVKGYHRRIELQGNFGLHKVVELGLVLTAEGTIVEHFQNPNGRLVLHGRHGRELLSNCRQTFRGRLVNALCGRGVVGLG